METIKAIEFHAKQQRVVAVTAETVVFGVKKEIVRIIRAPKSIAYQAWKTHNYKLL